MPRRFRSEDEGKHVVNADGDEIGTVERISENTAHVTPAANLSQQMRRRLGWEAEDEETYELPHDRVDAITADEIRLSENA